MSERGTKPLGDFEVNYVFDPKAVKVVNEFREEIERLESTLPSEFERRQISLIPAAENGKTKPEKTG